MAAGMHGYANGRIVIQSYFVIALAQLFSTSQNRLFF